MVAQHVGRVREARIVGRYHAAFPGGNRFAWMKGERGGDSERAGGNSAVARARCACRIFDDRNVRGYRRPELRHLGAKTEQMHGYHRLSSCSDPTGNIGWINIESDSVDIGENRHRSAIKYDIGGRDPGKGRHDDFVSGAYAHRRENQMQSGGATRSG